MQNSYGTFDCVAAMRGLHRLQESGASGERQDAFLRSVGIKLESTGTSTPSKAVDKWCDLPLPDLNRPAFFMKSARELVTERKCPSCKADICPDEFKSEIQRKEYSISGNCQKCQARFFDDSDKGLGCEECYACVSGGSKPCQNEDGKDAAVSAASSKGTIKGICGPHYQCYAGFTCSLHGQKSIVFIDAEDKHETWGCSECGAENWFRVRQYDAFGDEL